VSSRVAEKQRRKQERLELERRLAAKQRRQRRARAAATAVVGVILVGAAVAIITLGGTGSSSSGGTGGPFGTHYEGLQERRLAANVPTMSEAGGAVHIHPKLAIFANGRRISIPANIGIDPKAGDMMGLHTHDSAGTLHVEAVDSTLGQFFAVWGVALSRTRLGPYRAKGRNAVRMWVDGKPSQALGSLKLEDGQQIAIAYGPKNAPPPRV
jgi:hypothetical protein